MNKNSLTKKSKYLSFLLRHDPQSAGLSLDVEGWCNVELLSEKTDLTFEELEAIVESDEKKRYAFNKTRTLIRANQGHSTNQVNLAFEERHPPIYLFHGTGQENYVGIMKTGLKPMNRHHVHFSDQFSVAQTVGKRHKGALVVLVIDTSQMVLDGFKFYISENNVWLVDHVPVMYLACISNLK